MIIKSIYLKNFRSYADATVDLCHGVTIVAGLNGAGKSTLLDAIAVCLTGTARGADSGRHLGDLRGPERSKWMIELAIDSQDKDTTSSSDSFEIKRREGEGPRSAVQSQIDTMFGIPAATIRACLYSGELLRLDRKNAAKLVMDLVQHETVSPSPQLADLMRAQNVKDWDKPLSLADIDRLYKEFYESRRTTGKALKEIGVCERPEAPKGLEKLAADDEQYQRNARRGLDNKIREMEEERETLIHDFTVAEFTKENITKDLDSLEEQRDNVKEKMARIPSPNVVRDECKKLSVLLKKEEESWEHVLKQGRELDLQRAKATEECRAAAAHVEQIAKLEEKCPVCGHKIARVEWEKMDRDAHAAHTEAIEKLGNLKKALTALPDQRQDQDRIIERLDELDALEIEREKLESTLAQIDKEIGSAGVALARSESKKSHADDPTAKAEALAKRIDAGRKKLSAVDTYLGAVSEYRKSAATRTEVQNQYDDLDNLCKLLGPDGIRKDLAGGGGIKEFQEQLNKHLGCMGFQVDLMPLLKGGESIVNGLPARLLSSSERIRFGLAFQIAVASASGFGLVVVDDFDRLDVESKSAAFPLLQKCGHQVFVLQTIKGSMDAYRTVATVQNHQADVRYLLVEKTENGSHIEMPADDLAKRTG